jgi:hypothetical protein
MDLHYSVKPDPDLHESENFMSFRLEAQNWPWKAVDDQIRIRIGIKVMPIRNPGCSPRLLLESVE